MALLSLKVLNIYKIARLPVLYRACSSLPAPRNIFTDEHSTSKTNRNSKKVDNLIFYDDPDVFGTIAGRIATTNIPEDEGDKKEDEYLSEKVLPAQKLTIKQYADLMKQYLEHKRLKEAINVLEVRMLTVDKVKPENYIYNILIGACADVGYTRKAFKLFNDMKRRALKPTGDTYTCLFSACANSPWKEDGWKRALQLREHMLEKGIEPNLTNYNAMIKAFGKCGDLKTAFKIVDEMTVKEIKIRVHTFNHLLMACISNKDNGLRHALVVWRKMLKMREKPNIFSFNLMLRCVKDCNLGGKEDIIEMLESMQRDIQIALNGYRPNLQINNRTFQLNNTTPQSQKNIQDVSDQSETKAIFSTESSKPTLVIVEKVDNNIEVVQRMPNMLAKIPEMSNVLSIKDISTVQEKFALIGGQEDFLKEMQVYDVKPDIKTFTQMLLVLEENKNAEVNLIKAMKEANVRADIDFYNMLIKKRCLRNDYSGAFEVMTMIEEEQKLREKKHHPMNKKIRLNPNIMTYGVLAMACRTKEDCNKLLEEMQQKQLKLNIEICGALLRQASVQCEFGRVIEIMKLIKKENIKVNKILLGHLETFNEKCEKIIEEMKQKKNVSQIFKNTYEIFFKYYKRWLREVEVDHVLNEEHPWKQFDVAQPDTVQRQSFKVEEPKKYYKPNRKFVKPYKAR